MLNELFSYEEIDYLEYVNAVSPSICDLGYSDGYADLPDHSPIIVEQLYGKMPKEDLIVFVSNYLQGYEVGCYMSDHADEIYDEDGCILDEITFEPTYDHMNEAEELINQYIIKLSSGIPQIKRINKAIMKLRELGISIDNVSDGFHTFGDYKDARNTHFIALCNAYPSLAWKSKKHFDEKNDPIEDFNGDFIAGINTPEGPISQHLKLKYWDELEVPEIEHAPQYDGYTQEESKKREKSLMKVRR